MVELRLSRQIGQEARRRRRRRKPYLKSLNSRGSSFITLVPSRSRCQILAVFSGDKFLKTVGLKKEKESRCFLFTSSVNREIRRCTSQSVKKCIKKRDAPANLFLANLNLALKRKVMGVGNFLAA